LPIITFSNGKVRKKKRNYKILDTLIIGTYELELEGKFFLIKLSQLIELD